MASKKREKYNKLTRWVYFTKNLYNNTSDSVNFTYDKVIYAKSEQLQAIDTKSQNVNHAMLLGLIAMFLFATRLQNIYIVLAYFVLVIAGEIYRFCLLPKDIMQHLTDTGFKER